MTEPEMTPLQRHLSHVEARRQIFEGMPPGPGKDRMEALWRQAAEEHQEMVEANEQ